MLDGYMRRVIDSPLDRIGVTLAAVGASANWVTLAGLAVGFAAAVAIALGQPLWGLVLVLISRLFDGLDGAVARATRKTDFGGYLDIVADFAFYGAIPLAFAVWMPNQNALPAAFLIMSFYVNGASFLGYAVLAERHGHETRSRGVKSLFFSGGLLEGTETIAFFVLICVLPDLFAVLAWSFGALTLVTMIGRVISAWRVYGAETLSAGSPVGNRDHQKTGPVS